MKRRPDSTRRQHNGERHVRGPLQDLERIGLAPEAACHTRSHEKRIDSVARVGVDLPLAAFNPFIQDKPASPSPSRHAFIGAAVKDAKPNWRWAASQQTRAATLEIAQEWTRWFGQAFRRSHP